MSTDHARLKKHVLNLSRCYFSKKKNRENMSTDHARLQKRYQSLA
jgi:hypothetical protein